MKRRVETRENGHEVQDGGHIQMLAERDENIVNLLGAVLCLRRRPNAVDVVFGNSALDGQEDEQRLACKGDSDLIIIS